MGLRWPAAAERQAEDQLQYAQGLEQSQLHSAVEGPEVGGHGFQGYDGNRQ